MKHAPRERALNIHFEAELIQRKMTRTITIRYDHATYLPSDAGDEKPFPFFEHPFGKVLYIFGLLQMNYFTSCFF